MSDPATAEILPFPVRAGRPVSLPPALVPHPKAAPTPDERLRSALVSLNNAVARQQAALTAWRSALGDLSTVTGGLGSSLRTYQHSLDHLQTRVTLLNSQAVKLETLADAALVTKA